MIPPSHAAPLLAVAVAVVLVHVMTTGPGRAVTEAALRGALRSAWHYAFPNTGDTDAPPPVGGGR